MININNNKYQLTNNKSQIS